MRIDCQINTQQLEERMELSAKNIAYATVNAINATAKQVQAQAQTNLKSRFTLRKPDFMLRQAAIIKPFASVGQGRPFAEIAVGQKDRLLLSEFETGGQRHGFIGKNVAVPIPGSPARPTFESPVEPSLMISALNLQPPLSAAQRQQRKSIKGSSGAETRSLRRDFTKAAGAGQVWKGKEHTYMIPSLGIFQRTGPKKGDTVMLYKFKPSVQLKPQLGFLSMAKQDGHAWLQDNIEHAVINEIERKRR